MLRANYFQKIFSICLLSVLSLSATDQLQVRHESEQACEDKAETRRINASGKHARQCPDDDCCPSESTLRLAKLCATKIKANCLDVINNINASSACIDQVKSRLNCASQVTADTGCINQLKSNVICAETLNAVDFCTTGSARFGSLEYCQKFRAEVAFSADTLYTLGAPLNFNIVLDDPNGNISFAPTTYNVPASGYYLIMLQVDTSNLQGADVILGAPVSNPQIIVNGVVHRQTFIPYLTFHNVQFNTYSAILRLNAGDKVTTKHEVLVVTDAGFTPYVGTVIVSGNGTADNESLFVIHYLSSNCPIVPCVPTDCGFTCEPCTTTCQPCCPIL